ncbi:MAG TPA: trypsin-like peptidase domain-containing protein [Gemmatimonadales bacterium]|nr:trypsin-like peptidase domain-containing protein [Gemmatimonadales bacterium]
MPASASRKTGLEQLSDDLAAAVERAAQTVVAVNGRPRIAASGVLWRAGVVVTAHHTLRREEDLTVTLADNRTVPATVAGRDGATDLAVLKLDAPGSAEFADGAVKVGHLVLQVGRTGSAGHSASLGLVGAIVGPWRTWRGGEIESLIQLDLAIHDGFSGSPLIDTSGKVVGLNTSGLGRGVALALPVPVVNRVVDGLLAKGRIARGYLGVGLQAVEVPAALAAKFAPPARSGLIALTVDADGPAGRAGLQLGDVIVTVAGQPVADVRDLFALLGPERVGATVVLTGLRGGAPLELKVTVGERPTQ